MEPIEVSEKPYECEKCGCKKFDTEDIEVERFGDTAYFTGLEYTCVKCGQSYERYDFE